MTQMIDGTDAPEGCMAYMEAYGCRSCEFYRNGCNGRMQCTRSQRPDKMSVWFERTNKPRMILCSNGHRPEPPEWAKSFRAWHRDGGCSLWAKIDFYESGKKVVKGCAVEFSGKKLYDHHRD